MARMEAPMTVIRRVPRTLSPEPPAHGRRGVRHGHEGAEGEVRPVVAVAELLHHVEDDDRGHPVVAEPLPHLDQEQDGERHPLLWSARVRTVHGGGCLGHGEAL
jgi:hypothetical protein